MIKEILTNTNILEELMKDLIVESKLSLPNDVPIAAGIYEIIDEVPKLIVKSHNTTETLFDPTNHAEMSAIREATSQRKDWRLENYFLVSTLEPCIMCTGALVQSRIGGVFFGAYEIQYGACGSIYNFLSDPRLNHNTVVVGGILESDCSEVLNSFFSQLRKH